MTDGPPPEFIIDKGITYWIGAAVYISQEKQQ